MRLFGNMYAGELLFMLIALMGGAAAMSLSGVLLPIGHIIAGSIWSIFHILIVALAGFHLHDADPGVHRSGARRTLISVFLSFPFLNL
jgi:hypothetical protein